MDNQASKLFDAEERAKILNLKYSVELKLIHNTFVQSYPKNVIVAGGYFTSIFHGEEVKDVDIFNVDIFILKNTSDEDYGRMINAFDSYVSGDTNIVKKDSKYLTTNNPNIVDVWYNTATKEQYIFTKYKSREELIDHFDSEHACVSYEASEKKLHISRLTYEAIRDRLLIPHNGNIIADWRREKFLRRGFRTIETVGV